MYRHRASRTMSEDRDVALPIHRSATYRLDDEDYEKLESGRAAETTIYTRWGNPTNRAVGARIADLEGAEKGQMTASGMGAIASTVLGLLPEGGTLLATPVLYGGTRGLFDDLLARLGFGVRYEEAGTEAFAQAAEDADLIYTEPITNPLVRVIDVPAIARTAREAGGDLVVDNTFPTPVLFRPLEHGADVVVHSATKYLSGHSDVVAGCIATDEERWERIWDAVTHLGPTLDPAGGALVDRGLKTLDLRVERHCDNAQAVAEHLADHAAVEQVHYPGLPDHPDHDRARKLLDGFGGMVAFDVGDGDRAKAVMRDLEVFIEAPSLGGVESLVSMPANTSHVYLDAKDRRALGIADGLIRLSVGIEPVDELIGDLDRALA